MTWIALSDKTAGYSAEHHPLGQGGLWKHKGWQLPAYIQNVAKGLMESGKDRSTAIQMAIGAVKRWASGGGGVTPEVRAASAAAVAEWEKLRGQAHSTSRTGSALELNQVASAAGAARYGLPIGTQLGANGKPLTNQAPAASGAAPAAGQVTQQAKQLVSSMPDTGLMDAHQRLSAMGASGGPDVAAAQALVAAELAKRGYATNADGSITRTQIGQGGLAQQAHAQANQANYANQRKIAAAKLAAANQKKQAAAAKPKAAPKAKAAPKPKAAPKAKKAAAPAKPHWFTNPANALELSTPVGYSGQGPRITDRYGMPVVGSQRKKVKK